MFKMFQAQLNPGGDPEFWDTNWEAGETIDSVPGDAACENSAIHPLIMEKTRTDGLFLEGGCGPGHWVKYLHERGYRVVGVDFAPRAVSRLHRLLPDADVRVSTIQQLPFEDGEVQVYYSGGVVEHDEGGPEPALREAHRVIGQHGWFLCSVPDASPLRQFLYRRDSTQRPDMSPPMVVRRVDRMSVELPPPGMHFFQYVFSKAEFSSLLENAGFEVVDTFGYSLTWGVMEIPGITRLAHRALRRSAMPRQVPESGNGAPASPPLRASRTKALLKRALVREDRTLPVVGPVIQLATENLSNLRMYVARPRARA
jgi:SAM-dependent methyltransferase